MGNLLIIIMSHHLLSSATLHQQLSSFVITSRLTTLLSSPPHPRQYHHLSTESSIAPHIRIFTSLSSTVCIHLKHLAYPLRLSASQCQFSPDCGRTSALVGGQADMILDPATGAATVIGVYRGTCTVCAPWPKVTVLQRAYEPAWLGRASSKRW